MMQRQLLLLGTSLASGLIFGSGFHNARAEDKRLETIHVTAEPSNNDWIEPQREGPQTVYHVGREALKLYDNPGGANPYTSVAEIPGVKVTNVDPYGLNNLQGGQKGMRVRGEVSTHGVAGTVEGLVLNGPGPADKNGRASLDRRRVG